MSGVSTQTQAAQTDSIELVPIPKASNSPTNLESAALERHTHPAPAQLLRRQVLECYDPEVCAATEVHFVPANNPQNPLRVKLRNISASKIPRRAVQIALMTLIVTSLYYIVSLAPAFQAAGAASKTVQLQGESGQDTRHGLIFDFLQECASRKAQALPLGLDCIKYLAKTPKAPKDIDDWMVDPPAPKFIRRLLAIRDTVFSLTQEQLRPGTALTNPETHPSWSFGIFAAQCFVGIVVLSAALYLVYPRLLSKFARIYYRAFGRQHQLLEASLGRNGMGYLTKGFFSLTATLFICCLIFLYRIIFYKPNRWSVVSEFIENCKLLKEQGLLSLNDDCVTYLEKTLSPPPTLTISDRIAIAFGTASILVCLVVFIIMRRTIAIHEVLPRHLSFREEDNTRFGLQTLLNRSEGAS